MMSSTTNGEVTGRMENPGRQGAVPQTESGANIAQYESPSSNPACTSVSPHGSQSQQVHQDQASHPQVHLQAYPIPSSSSPGPHSSRTPSTTGFVGPAPSNSLGSTRRNASPPKAAPTMLETARQYNDMFAQKTMLQRLESSIPQLEMNSIEHDRIALLREAVERLDMNFIVLSQILALRAAKSPLVPTSFMGIPAESFTILDGLLCANDRLTEPVLTLFASFPATIQDIYASPVTSGLYELNVTRVKEFLKHLPKNWDALVHESRGRLAPPLVEEFDQVLRLRSPVLQTTAFRAISRMLIDQASFAAPEVGIDKLVYLHHIDQKLFSAGYRQSLRDKASAYAAFHNVREALKQHESSTAKHKQAQQHLPDAEKQPSPVFELPLGALEAIRSRNLRAPDAQRQRIGSASETRTLPLTQARRPLGQPQQPQESIGVNRPTADRVTISIFPEGGLPRPQPVNPDPLRSALHQAHLRSPRFVPAHAHFHGSRLYRYVRDFALPPTRLNKQLPVQSIPFSISPDNFASIPKYTPSPRSGEPPTRCLTESSQTYRLRCVALPPGHSLREDLWIVAETYWPENLFLECNETILEPRRKLHFKRHLPIDITPYLKVGENSITAIINRMANDPRPFDYVVAVETVGVMELSSLKAGVRRITREDSLTSIKNSLLSINADPEISIVSSNTTIQLFDPHSSSKMCAVPVRGASCVHRDCFDLDTFLRLRKREHPTWPTAVDCWQCPLCRGDVRPQTLVLDEFLVDVRSQLEKDGLLGTRAIVVEADGSWRPKEEARSGVRSPGLQEQESGASAIPCTARKAVEVVEID